jgi:hypothetical protein
MRHASFFLLSCLILVASLLVGYWVWQTVQLQLWQPNGASDVHFAILVLVATGVQVALGLVLVLTSTSRLLARPSGIIHDLGQRWRRALEGLADAIKDALLDWGPEEARQEETGPVPAGALSRVAVEELVEAMRAPTERTLRQVAALVNQPATAGDVTGQAERIGPLLNDLLWETLALGVQLRTDATALQSRASTSLPAYRKPRFKSLAALGYRLEWAEKYRHIRTLDLAERLAGQEVNR